MSEWITDRAPTDDDGYYVTSTEGIVWITNGHDVEVALYHEVDIGTPWMPITAPEPYVKPKRYLARYDSLYGYWAIFKTKGFVRVASIWDLTENNDQHREAAERIAATYDEAIP